MKTTMKLLAIALLALPQTMHGQHFETISNAVEKILNKKGVVHSTIQNIHHDEDGEGEEVTFIHNFTIGRANFYLLDELKKAFLEEDRQTSVYTCFDPIADSYRQQWTVRLQDEGNFRVGDKEGSSYAIAIANDPFPEHKDYRHVFTAEWWDTADKDIKQGVLLYTYGKKPATRSKSRSTEWDEVMRNWQSRVGDKIDVQKFMNMADSLMALRSFGFQADFANDPEAWARQAIAGVEQLNASEWLRLFGMLTQKMLDRPASDDVAIASGILLDLSKHATGLDKDEREVCAARLRNVAVQMLRNHDQYAHDLLMLAAKKLQQKE